MKDLLEQLYAPFKIRERQGAGGRNFKFVESSDVIDRMNKTFNGKWTTEITGHEIIENQVLIRVKVHVQDPESGAMYSHEGFASHDIARFGSGQKQGQVISIGNDFKSATSKAIRTACSRWGVALYLEEESSKPSGGAVYTNPTPSNKPVDNGPVGGPSANVSSGPSAQFSGPPREDVKVEQPAEESKPVTNNGPPMAAFGGSPPQDQKKTSVDEVPIKSGGPNDGPSFLEGSSNNDNISIIPTNTGSEDGFVSPDDEEEDSVLTSVQKVAIETIMEQNGVDFPFVLDHVFKDKNRASSIESLSYLDAIEVIQAGNKLNKS